VPLEGRVTLPEFANVCGFLMRQLYNPGAGDVIVKKPLASVLVL
jgi:hypothetical protein